MNVDPADLRAFVAVAELGAFHAAAETMHLSPPALSRRNHEVSISTLLGLVDARLGIAVPPRPLMRDSGHPTLACVPLVAPTVTRTPGLIRKRGRALSPAAQQLYGLIGGTAQSRTATALDLVE